MSPLESVLKRDRLVVIVALASITLFAWGYMMYEARAMYHTGICRCAGMTMSGPDANPWSAATLPPLFLMWSEMMVAMMLPSAAPMILTFAAVNRQRREHERPFVSAGIFMMGYLIAWTGFSALAALAQWILHGKALLSPMMVNNSPVFGGALLILAGIFQWTPLKGVCLRHCRSPFGFLLSDWRDGKWGAMTMGIKHGAYCTGCCWLLMTLLFIAGVMNLWWIAILAVFVLLEKVVPRGMWVGRAAGVLLVIWGVWMILR
jgi:predicted metal-binding membrane protein